jgi:hypothetical protein
VLASLAGGGALGWSSQRFVEAPMLALEQWSVRKDGGYPPTFTW